MKLTPRTYQIYRELHAWLGVSAALIVYVTFFLGAFALFRHELNAWANPAPAPAAAPPALQPLLEALDREQPLLGKERVAFLPEPAGLRAYWHGDGQRHEFRYSPASGRLEPLRSDLGTFLHRMHFLGPLPRGVYAAGLGALALLLGLVTGVLIHFRDLLRHGLRWRSAAPRSWASALHELLGVLALPFQLGYAWTGAMLALGLITVEPALLATLFRGDRAAASAVHGDAGEPPAPSGRPLGQLPQLDQLLARARRELPELQPNWIGIEYVGDERSSVSIYGDVTSLPFGSAGVMLNAADGAVLGVMRAEHTHALERFEAWFFGLHRARFGHAAKLLYALLALVTCGVLASGNLIWLRRREARSAHWSNQLLERASAGVCVGLIVATAALLGASRWPGVAAGRGETTAFWLVWGACAAAAFLLRSSRRACALGLLAASLLWAAALGIDLLSVPHALADPPRRATDALLLVLCSACGAGGLGLLRARASAPAARDYASLSALDTRR
jgi:uncharacterized iron-regulated membrane protein